MVEKMKYFVALFLAHLFVALIIGLILYLFSFIVYSNQGRDNLIVLFVVGIFSIVGAVYLFKRNIVFIYPSVRK